MRRLVVSIDAGSAHCGGCDFRVSEMRWCVLFSAPLQVEHCLDRPPQQARLRQCLDAEREAGAGG